MYNTENLQAILLDSLAQGLFIKPVEEDLQTLLFLLWLSGMGFPALLYQQASVTCPNPMTGF